MANNMRMTSIETRLRRLRPAPIALRHCNCVSHEGGRKRQYWSEGEAERVADQRMTVCHHALYTYRCPEVPGCWHITKNFQE